MPVAAGVVGDLRIGAVLVLAARDMTAERCRAAVLDRRHHLELAEAHMAGIGLAPVHGRGRYPRPPILGGTWPRAVMPAAGHSWSSGACEATTAGRAAPRWQRSGRWQRACSAPWCPICRAPTPLG